MRKLLREAKDQRPAKESDVIQQAVCERQDEEVLYHRKGQVCQA